MTSDDLEALARAFATGGPDEGLLFAAALERAGDLDRALTVLRQCAEMDLYGSSEFRGMRLDREIDEATRRIEARLGIAPPAAPAPAPVPASEKKKLGKTRGPVMPPIPADADSDQRAKYESQVSEMLDFGVEPPAYDAWLAMELAGGTSSAEGACTCAAGLKAPSDNPHLVVEARPTEFEMEYRCARCGQRWACESDIGYHFPIHHMRRLD
jgi:hypothetical protein